MNAARQLSLKGQVAVITGAGQGIGRCHALELARRGAAVVVNDLVADSADVVVAEIKSLGGSAVASHATVTTPEGGQAIVNLATEHFGTIDILINNAGFLRNGYFEDLTADDIRSVIDVHLLGAFFVSQPAWRAMKEQKYGRILMTGSGSGMFGHQGLANYSAAKSGLYGLTKALAYEGADFGIQVNLIMPIAQTAITDHNPIPDWQDHLNRFLTSAERDALGNRPKPPELIASLAAFLVSRECSLSGEAFSVAHGRFAKLLIGVADGWLPSDVAEVSAEAIRAHISVIRNLDKMTIPMSLYEEKKTIASRILSHGSSAPRA